MSYHEEKKPLPQTKPMQEYKREIIIYFSMKVNWFLTLCLILDIGSWYSCSTYSLCCTERYILLCPPTYVLNFAPVEKKRYDCFIKSNIIKRKEKRHVINKNVNWDVCSPVWSLFQRPYFIFNDTTYIWYRSKCITNRMQKNWNTSNN